MSFCAMKINTLFKLRLRTTLKVCVVLRRMMRETTSGPGFLKHCIYNIISFGEIYLIQFESLDGIMLPVFCVFR